MAGPILDLRQLARDFRASRVDADTVKEKAKQVSISMQTAAQRTSQTMPGLVPGRRRITANASNTTPTALAGIETQVSLLVQATRIYAELFAQHVRTLLAPFSQLTYFSSVSSYPLGPTKRALFRRKRMPRRLRRLLQLVRPLTQTKSMTTAMTATTNPIRRLRHPRSRPNAIKPHVPRPRRSSSLPSALGSRQKQGLRKRKASRRPNLRLPKGSKRMSPLRFLQLLQHRRRPLLLRPRLGHQLRWLFACRPPALPKRQALPRLCGRSHLPSLLRIRVAPAPRRPPTIRPLGRIIGSRSNSLVLDPRIIRRFLRLLRPVFCGRKACHPPRPPRRP